MRKLILILSACLSFAATVTFDPPDANAVVCARGPYRAGCAGYRGGVYRGPYRAGVVVGRPVVACRWVWEGGVRIRRCY